MSQGSYKLGPKRNLREMRDLSFVDQLGVFTMEKEVIFMPLTSENLTASF